VFLLPATTNISVVFKPLTNTYPPHLPHPHPPRFSLLRNFDGGEGFDAWARRALFRLLGEDVTTLEASAAASLASADGGAEDSLSSAAGGSRSGSPWVAGALRKHKQAGSTTSDAGLAARRAFRSLRQEWLELGYGAPPESVAHRRTLADQ
jgi:hypothetical protein